MQERNVGGPDYLPLIRLPRNAHPGSPSPRDDSRGPFRTFEPDLEKQPFERLLSAETVELLTLLPAFVRAPGIGGIGSP